MNAEEYKEYLLEITEGHHDFYTLENGETIEFTYDGESIGITGPMKSGKSDELINRTNIAKIGNASVLVIKPAMDTRQSGISSRRNLAIDAVPFDNIIDRKFVEMCIGEYPDVIGIDEGHFVNDIDVFVHLMVNLGKTVYISYLNGSYTQRQFENIIKLAPLLSEEVRLTAICADCPYGKVRPAIYTILCDEVNASNIKNEILVGDSEYKPVCWRCLNDHRSNKHK